MKLNVVTEMNLKYQEVYFPVTGKSGLIKGRGIQLGGGACQGRGSGYGSRNIKTPEKVSLMNLFIISTNRNLDSLQTNCVNGSVGIRTGVKVLEVMNIKRENREEKM